MDKFVVKSAGSGPSKPPSTPKQSNPSAGISSPRTPTSGSSQSKAKAAATPENSTPDSENSRGRWTPILVKIGKTIQINILCRNSLGRCGPYTSAGSAAKKRPCWAPISDCQYITETKRGKVKKFFVFKNIDNETAKFRADLLNPLLQSGAGTPANPFSQKCTDLHVGNPRLLAFFFSALSFSENFCNFNADTHYKNGLKKDGNGLGDKFLQELGGSLAEYEAFVKAAEENPLDVGGEKAVNVGGEQDQGSGFKISPASTKKITDFFNINNEKKLSRSEKVEDNYRHMLSEEGGLEKSVVSSYVNFQSIPLDKLSVSPDMFLLMNQTKVNEIAESMLDRYDPSQVVVSVVPADLIGFEIDGSNDNFWVIHGRHRLEALKKLDEMRKLQDLPGFPEDRSIQCYILKVSAPSLSNYFNIRSNDLSSDFQTRTSNEELFFVYKGLLHCTKDKHKSLEVIEKVCHSRHMGASDLTVYNKVAEWPVSVLDQLISVLEKFQSYQTKDATARGAQAKIRRREAKTLTKAMFRQIGNCSPGFFQDWHEKVLSNEVSLRELLEKSDESNKIAKAEMKVVSCAGGSEDINSLKRKFPDKFNREVVKKFVGAEVTGKKRNVQGQLLKNYVKSVQLGKPFKEAVKFETFEHFSELNSDKFEGFDVIVLNVFKDNMEFVKYWIDTLSQSCSVKDHFSIFLILEHEKELKEVYKALYFWKDKTDFQILQCMFRKERSEPNLESINENVIFSVLFGKVNIFKGELLSLNGLIDNDLVKVISKVTPPSGKVAYVSRGDSKVVKIHKNNSGGDEITEVQVVYFVTEAELPQLQDKFFIKAPDTASVNSAKQFEKDTEITNSTDDEGGVVGSGGSDDISDSSDDDMAEEFDQTQMSNSCVENCDLSKQSSTSSVSY